MSFTALIAWFAGSRIQFHKNECVNWCEENSDLQKEAVKAKKQYFQKKQKTILVITVSFILGVWIIYKYINTLVADIGLQIQINSINSEKILLLLGVSYYSLQLIGYVVDVYRDIIPAENDPIKVVLYGCFFLSIMQGPFNRYNDLMPQICTVKRKKIADEERNEAVLRIVWGYIKKLCIANQVCLITNEVFKNCDQYFGLGIILAIVCFAVQLYADFSGYMDIIVGVGSLFGIQMPENFRQPFFSRNLSEFWKRWHITLGLWLQDYVFYPILKTSFLKRLGNYLTKKFGKKAGRRIPTYCGMLVLWTLIGAWHGLGFNYVFGVGILQFLYIFLGEICKPFFTYIKRILKINEKTICWHIFQSVRTTVLMMIAWVFFNSSTFSQALIMLKNIFVFPRMRQVTQLFYSGAVPGEPLNWSIYIFVVCIVSLVTVDLIHEKTNTVYSVIKSKPFPIRLAFGLALLFFVLIFGAYGSQYASSNFIYFDF